MTDCWNRNSLETLAPVAYAQKTLHSRNGHLASYPTRRLPQAITLRQAANPIDTYEELLVNSDEGLSVEVIGAVACKLAVPPQDIVTTGSAEVSFPAEMIIAASANISYDRSVALWKEGDWVEVTTKLPHDSMGVQIHGDHSIGWASVFLDGNEVRHDDAFDIWSHSGRHGGYIQVYGFEPGQYTIRVENLSIDNRSATVEIFGFGPASDQY